MDNADEDAPDNRLALYQEQVVAIEALNYFTEWCETKEDELEDGEGFGDRLLGLMVAVADDNQDGELDDDEQELVTIGLQAATLVLVDLISFLLLKPIEWLLLLFYKF